MSGAWDSILILSSAAIFLHYRNTGAPITKNDVTEAPTSHIRYLFDYGKTLWEDPFALFQEV